jgi:hypothetical protein
MSCLHKTKYEFYSTALHVRIFWIFRKVVHPLKLYQHTTRYDTTLTVPSFASTSKV